ncbi:MAG TPA: hypothetical protein VMH31_07785, partial [Methylomirabilota bacterium]|nr:hypothetical protein [Methylomirabilota bacterium]
AKVEIEQLTPPSRPCVRGSLVIQERVTELLDMPALLTKLQSTQLQPAVLVSSETEAPHVR